MNNCPCCSSTLLRHVRHSQIYWYCPHCKQEMPNFGDWINAKAFVKTANKHSCPAQTVPSSAARNPRLKEKELIQTCLVQGSEITPIHC